MIAMCHDAVKAAAGAIFAAASLALLGSATAQADTLNDFKTLTGDVYCQMNVLPDGAATVACEGGGPYTGPSPDCAHGNWATASR